MAHLLTMLATPGDNELVELFWLPPESGGNARIELEVDGDREQ